MAFPPLVQPGPPLTAQELERYGRHLLLPDLGMEGQRRLKNARVLVVGAGGLGSPALLYLAAAGVGTIGIADADVVDTSNLQRQIVHGSADVGRLKTESAQETVSRVNPLVTVVRHDVVLDARNAMEVLAGYDVVLDGTDNFPTRYLLNDACVFSGIPCVWGSIYRFDGQASVWSPAMQGPCYRCVFPEPPPPGMVPSCAEGGVLGVLCGVVGSVQAGEALKLITGIGDPLVGRLLAHDALRQSWDTLPVRPDPSCALCGPAATVTELVDYQAFCGVPSGQRPPEEEISAAELRALLDTTDSGQGTDTVVVDVRSPAERAIASIPGAVAVEMSEFRSGAALSAVPQDRPVVLYCASGVRSAEATSILRAAGRADVRSLKGGIATWLRAGDSGQ